MLQYRLEIKFSYSYSYYTGNIKHISYVCRGIIIKRGADYEVSHIFFKIFWPLMDSNGVLAKKAQLFQN